MAINRIVSFSIALTAVAFLAACGDKTEAPSDNVDVAMNDQKLQDSEDASNSALDWENTIPYPVYPNGSQYRVGGENGLKIILFETSDTFEQVDKFYKERSDENQMSRLVAMSDYVRYSSNEDDKDPWATYRPGIVIHQFNDDKERQAVGADSQARTNIIMSF